MNLILYCGSILWNRWSHFSKTTLFGFLYNCWTSIIALLDSYQESLETKLGKLQNDLLSPIRVYIDELLKIRTPIHFDLGTTEVSPENRKALFNYFNNLVFAIFFFFFSILFLNKEWMESCCFRTSRWNNEIYFFSVEFSDKQNYSGRGFQIVENRRGLSS